MTSSEELNELRSQIVDLQKQLGSTGGIDPLNISLKEARKAVGMLSRELREMNGELSYINESFRDALNELSKQNDYLKSGKKALSSIASISSQIVEHRKGESVLNIDQIKKLQHKAKLQFQEIQIALKKGDLDAKSEAAFKQALIDRIDFNDELGKTLILENKINRQIGLAGVALKGFADLMRQVGLGDLSKPFSDAIEKTKDARRQLALNKEELDQLNKRVTPLLEEEKERRKVLEEQIKELEGQTSKYKNIVKEVGKQLTLTNLVDFSIGKIIKNFFEVNKASVEFQRLTGQNVTIVGSLNTRFATTVDFLKTASELTQQIGFNAVSIFGPDQLAALAEAKNLLGLSGQEAENLALQSKVSGNTIDSFQDGLIAGAKAANIMAKSAVAPGVVFKDVLNTSKGISASLGNNPERLARAATAARAFGMELKQVDSIANSLLNFESSIEAELEAQLLTGKNINLAKARELALTNDLEGLSAELAKNGATAAEFANMNRIAQESLAKAVGMSRDDLAKSILLQESSKDLSDEQRASVLGITKEQLQQVDIQERLSKSMDKLAQSFAPILDLLVPVVDLFGTLLNYASILTMPISIAAEGIRNILTLFDGGAEKLTFWQGVLGSIALIWASIKGYAMVTAARTAAIASLESTIALHKKAQAIFGAKDLVLGKSKLLQLAAQAALWALMNPIKTLVGLAAAAMVTSAATSYINKAGDLNSPAKGKTRVSTKEGGLFELSPNDDLIAAPGASAIMESGGSSMSIPSINMQPLVAEIQAMKQELKAVLTTIANKEGSVYLDTDLVGKALVLGSTRM